MIVVHMFSSSVTSESFGSAPTSTESSYWRAYMFLEAQHMSAKVDGQNLGGDAAVLGFRMEFNFH